jgi:hypothetical protein
LLASLALCCYWVLPLCLWKKQNQYLSPADSIFVKDIGFVFLVGIFSIGLHWKAPEFAAAITGGMASGAGSIHKAKEANNDQNCENSIKCAKHTDN